MRNTTSGFYADGLLSDPGLDVKVLLPAQASTLNAAAAAAAAADVTPPTVVSFSPALGAVGVARSANVVVIFNEPILCGTGTITIVNALTGETVETIVPANSSQVTALGTMLTIDPRNDLSDGVQYAIQFAPGSVTDWDGNSFAGYKSYGFTVAETPALSHTVAGTLGNDVMVLGGGNQFMGGAGADTYVVSISTLANGTRALLRDTEGADVVQFVDGTVIIAGRFLFDAAELYLSNGSSIQILGGSHFSFQLGGNATAGDAASNVSFVQLAVALGVDVQTGVGWGMNTIIAPKAFVAAAPPTAAVARAPSTVAGTLANDYLVVTAGDNYRGGSGNDTYLIGRHTLAGPVTATIVDTEGSNIIQLVDSTVIASSTFLNDALQLTLSTGATVQVLGASKYGFQIGANAPAAHTAPTLSYAQFGAALGVAIPEVGAGGANGTPNFTVPTSTVGLMGVADGSFASEGPAPTTSA